nr:ferritin family protein [uncultured Desulfuromonas sp.]
MTSQQGVCYTFEAALEMALTMEQRCFRAYLQAIRTVKNRAAGLILKDAALDEIEHKQRLEKALIEGGIDPGDHLQQTMPLMNLDELLKQKELTPDADSRQALAYVIHLKKDSLEFYDKLAKGCTGAPMAPIFQQLANDESLNLQKLEDLYEEHFLTEN